MKKIIELLLLFFIVTIQLNAQTVNRSDESKVKEAIMKFFDGVATRDTKLMKQYSTNDFLLLEDGQVWNLDSLINKITVTKTGSFKRTNHFSFIRTNIKGKTAWVAYNNSAEFIVNGNKRNVQWMESALLLKHGKEWKIQLLHSTRLKVMVE